MIAAADDGAAVRARRRRCSACSRSPSARRSCQRYLLARVAATIDGETLDYITERLLRLPMRYFETRRTGDIERRAERHAPGPRGARPERRRRAHGGHPAARRGRDHGRLLAGRWRCSSCLAPALRAADALLLSSGCGRCSTASRRASAATARARSTRSRASRRSRCWAPRRRCGARCWPSSRRCRRGCSARTSR